MGEHIEVLEHHAHLLPVKIDVHLAGLGELSLLDELLFLLGQVAGDLVALEVDFAALRLFQQVQTPQKGALAAAGGADDGDRLALFNGLVHALEDVQLAIALMQINGFDHFHN